LTDEKYRVGENREDEDSDLEEADNQISQTNSLETVCPLESGRTNTEKSEEDFRL
jgi:hypothetical protein